MELLQPFLSDVLTAEVSIFHFELSQFLVPLDPSYLSNLGGGISPPPSSYGCAALDRTPVLFYLPDPSDVGVLHQMKQKR